MENNKNIAELNSSEGKSKNFLEVIIDNDIKNGKNENRVHTRFPPEPNGYLHIGHAKSICLNFGLAEKYNGKCNLRFDDTNPTKEEEEYVSSIKEDVRWLGFDWEDRLFYASDYFDRLFEWAVKLIKDGNAYVDDLSAEQISEQRGVPTRPGIESPFRNRSAKENLVLFMQMKNGEYKEGTHVLRAKIDMASPNMHMRDPVLYRIMFASHHRTGDKWCIYPMYDFTHGQSDYLEGITHSICTLEFEIHRPLYDWFLDNLIDTEYRPRQYEFARLNLSYTVMSKRKLLELVTEDYVNGWDDPRMPTVSGLRRRGYTPESIRNFANRIGIAKRENIIDVGLLEFSLREHLNKITPRIFAVLDPLKVIITNYPENQVEELELENTPEDPEGGSRIVPFSKEVYIEQSDFMEDPPKKFFRLGPGREVRLKGAYIIKCEDYKKDENGNIIELYCTYDPETKSGSGVQRKVKGTLHWVSVEHALDAEVRIYDRLFKNENPDVAEEGKDFKDNINPDSLKVINGKIEPSIKSAKVMDKFQFQRLGYFCVDADTTGDKLVFNRTVTLRDTWAKMSKK
ncbi:MAG: glutamine--tRNA ligase/YqeY domain fusion protein [Bacteroidales bacterium]|nr:glutamine--tRNA ligase/YqeY domain fusion protein [Bacteroidales bacterium]